MLQWRQHLLKVVLEWRQHIWLCLSGYKAARQPPLCHEPRFFFYLFLERRKTTRTKSKVVSNILFYNVKIASKFIHPFSFFRSYANVIFLLDTQKVWMYFYLHPKHNTYTVSLTSTTKRKSKESLYWQREGIGPKFECKATPVHQHKVIIILEPRFRTFSHIYTHKFTADHQIHIKKEYYY